MNSTAFFAILAMSSVTKLVTINKPVSTSAKVGGLVSVFVVALVVGVVMPETWRASPIIVAFAIYASELFGDLITLCIDKIRVTQTKRQIDEQQYRARREIEQAAKSAAVGQ